MHYTSQSIPGFYLVSIMTDWGGAVNNRLKSMQNSSKSILGLYLVSKMTNEGGM
jgi:hypothetical protein